MRVTSPWLVLALLAGCSSSHTSADASPTVDAVLCDPPADTDYSCPPSPPGVEGCRGAPLPYAAARIPDPEAVFAPGCTITFAFCHPYYPTSDATCECSTFATPDGTPDWTCPL